MPPDAITDYVTALRGGLSVDARDAGRIAAEVEDHLREAAETRFSDDVASAQAQAVVSFGDHRSLARQLSTVWLYRRIKSLGALLVASVAAVGIGMVTVNACLRLARDGQPLLLSPDQVLIVSVDRGASLIAICISIAVWAWVLNFHTPSRLTSDHLKKLNTATLASAVSAALLFASVIAETIAVTVQSVGLVSVEGALALAGILIIEMLAVTQTLRLTLRTGRVLRSVATRT